MAICIFFNKRATLSAVMSLAGCSLTGEPMLLHTSCTKKNKKKTQQTERFLKHLHCQTWSILTYLHFMKMLHMLTVMKEVFIVKVPHENPSIRSTEVLLLKCSVPVTDVTARGSGPLPKGHQINLMGFRWLKEEERINKSAFKMLPLTAFNIFKWNHVKKVSVVNTICWNSSSEKHHLHTAFYFRSHKPMMLQITSQVITNLPQGAVQSVGHTVLSMLRPSIQIKKVNREGIPPQTDMQWMSCVQNRPT